MKKYLPIIGAFLVIEIITTFIRFQNVYLETPVSFILFSVTVFFTVRKSGLAPAQVLRVFLITFFIVNLLVVIIDQSLPTVGAPNIIMQLVGIICGYLFTQKDIHRFLKISLSSISIIFLMWYILVGHIFWWHYIGYGTFTGRAETKVQSDWYLTTENNDTITATRLGNKIVIFDFWQTKCVYCYAKLPLVQALYQKYKGDNRILISAINIPVVGDKPGTAFSLKEEKEKYTIPLLAGDSIIAHKFEIEGYPTVIVMQNNKIYFKGDINMAGKTIDKLLMKEP